MFSAEDVQEMFCYKNGKEELITFSPRVRDPVPSSFQLSIKCFHSVPYAPLSADKWKMFGWVNVLIWADVAPKACEMLRLFVIQGHHFGVVHKVGRLTDADSRDFSSGVRKEAGKSEYATLASLGGDNSQFEKQSGLWSVADSVLLTIDESPKLTILHNKRPSWPGRQVSKKVADSSTGQPSGLVVGKVLSSSPNHLEELQDHHFPMAFECSVVETNH